MIHLPIVLMCFYYSSSNNSKLLLKKVFKIYILQRKWYLHNTSQQKLYKENCYNFKMVLLLFGKVKPLFSVSFYLFNFVTVIMCYSTFICAFLKQWLASIQILNRLKVLRVIVSSLLLQFYSFLRKHLGLKIILRTYDVHSLWTLFHVHGEIPYYLWGHELNKKLVTSIIQTNG